MTIENAQSQHIFLTVTLDRLKHVLHYDPETGIFTWINPSSSGMKTGDTAGSWSESGGCFRIMVDGTTYPLHKLAWFYMTGEWVKVDHIDRVKANNRFDNFRPCTAAQNSANQGVRMTNLLGVKGVQQRGRKFRAYITHNYRTIHLGTFDSIEEATEARQNAAKEYFGEFANG